MLRGPVNSAAALDAHNTHGSWTVTEKAGMSSASTKQRKEHTGWRPYSHFRAIGSTEGESHSAISERDAAGIGRGSTVTTRTRVKARAPLAEPYLLIRSNEQGWVTQQTRTQPLVQAWVTDAPTTRRKVSTMMNTCVAQLRVLAQNLQNKLLMRFPT